jgi:hypothetical protein
MRALLVATLAAAAALPSPGYGGEDAHGSQAEDAPLPRFGIAVDAGIPDGLAASAAFRPWRPLRLEAGITYNVLAFGLRAGVDVSPFALRVAPVFHAEIGHTFSADASGLAARFATLSATERVLLRDVGYDYVSGQLGVEVRASSRMAFFARGGLAYFWTTARHVQEAVLAENPASPLRIGDLSLRGTAPTGSLGVVLFFQ